MASLEEQLKSVKLKKSKGPIKDYSSPKVAGYLLEAEVLRYQHTVLDVNAERWMDALRDVTFTSLFCPLYLEEARLIIRVYEQVYATADPANMADINWQGFVTASDQVLITDMTQRLQITIEELAGQEGAVFVKTSSRSAKDAPLVKKQFRELYQRHLAQFPEDEQTEENCQLICLLTAAFQAMKVKSADQVIDMFFRSERIYQDMLLAVKLEDSFRENFVVREFLHIDIDMEFRGFVHNSRLTALSQYNYLIFSKRLVEQKTELTTQILSFFDEHVKVKMVETDLPTSYVIDFAVVNRDTGRKVIVIEINPFQNTTDGALFSWEHERHLLESVDNFEFRIVEKPKPGSKAMLPKSVRELLNVPS